jgi:hypothetical protein
MHEHKACMNKPCMNTPCMNTPCIDRLQGYENLLMGHMNTLHPRECRMLSDSQ